MTKKKNSNPPEQWPKLETFNLVHFDPSTQSNFLGHIRACNDATSIIRHDCIGDTLRRQEQCLGFTAVGIRDGFKRVAKNVVLTLVSHLAAASLQAGDPSPERIRSSSDIASTGRAAFSVSAKNSHINTFDEHAVLVRAFEGKPC